MYEGIIKIVSFSLNQNVLTDFKKVIDVIIYQIGLLGAAMFWKDRRNTKNMANTSIFLVLCELIHK